MVRFAALVATLATLAFAPSVATADTPPDHSTVRIVFVAPYDNPTQMMGGVQEGETPPMMATTGGTIVPFDSIRPVSISIDGEFVGHAMFGFDKVSPVFVLPSGNRKFTLKCDGFVPVTTDLRVLGTGSTQYLVVKMLPLDADSPDTAIEPAATVTDSKTGG